MCARLIQKNGISIKNVITRDSDTGQRTSANGHKNEYNTVYYYHNVANNSMLLQEIIYLLHDARRRGKSWGNVLLESRSI